MSGFANEMRSQQLEMAVAIGRASAPSALQHPKSLQVIDVDAEPVSSDDLNFLAEPSLITSTYFDPKHGPTKDESGGPTAGPSLIADGENTKLLQVKLTEVEPNRRSSSPIETFPEDEAIKKGAFEITKPRLKVLEQVAIFEAKFKPDLPKIDFKSRGFTSKMRSKGGNAVVRLQLTRVLLVLNLPQLRTLPLLPMNKSPGRSNNASSKAWTARLPISMLVIGVQRLPEYDTIVFTKGGAAITFESQLLSSRPIGPVSISNEVFCELQVYTFLGQLLKDETEVACSIQNRQRLTHKSSNVSSISSPQTRRLSDHGCRTSAESSDLVC